MYKTSHGFSDPGEQKDRNYKWSLQLNKLIDKMNKVLSNKKYAIKSPLLAICSQKYSLYFL